MKTILFTIFLSILSVQISNAQWQPDIRLTNDPAFSDYASLSVSGQAVHVVWSENRDGNPEIYYKRSTDGGISWIADTRLTNNTAVSNLASVDVSGIVVHVVWYDHRDGNDEIYYKRSTDAGVSWGLDIRLTINSAVSDYPSVAVSGSIVHVVWHDARDTSDIYYKRSTDAGVSWGADTRLTNTSIGGGQTGGLSISVSGQAVHVVWGDTRDGDFGEIYYKRSTDGGVSWGQDTRLTNNPAVSAYPSVSVSGSVVHVVWHDQRIGNYGISYKRSIDAGVSWSADTGLTSNISGYGYPSISISGSIVHVVYGGGEWEIYYKRSTNTGVSWETDTRLTNSPYYSRGPSVAVSGQIVHVVWQDDRDAPHDYDEIYYKRDPTGNVVGIININSEIPNQFSLSQNYPNPFNPVTKIRFDIPKNSVGQTLLSVYDILGQQVATLVNEPLRPGSYEVDWDASNYTSGIYYYKLSTGEFSETRKAVLIK